MIPEETDHERREIMREHTLQDVEKDPSDLTNVYSKSSAAKRKERTHR